MQIAIFVHLVFFCANYDSISAYSSSLLCRLKYGWSFGESSQAVAQMSMDHPRRPARPLLQGLPRRIRLAASSGDTRETSYTNSKIYIFYLMDK